MPLKILIVGKRSYIGNSIENWFGKFNGKYCIEKLSVRTDQWEDKDFSCYDVIIYVSAIVHQREKQSLKDLYYKVNYRMAVKVANKAKNAGVKQFIFISSMSIYGINQGVISKNTIPKPSSLYGKSKLLAETELTKLASEDFKVAIIRSPMVYGKNCKGNYVKLSRFLQIIPLFIKVKNVRSMIYIDNHSEFIRLMIDNNESGIFFPQNATYTNINDMVMLIAKVHKKKIRFIAIPNLILNMLLKFGIFNKILGSLVYEHSMSKYKNNYQIVDFKESIKLTEI